MGTYKVPQNVESEDKILGPLSLKQFIYAIIGLGYGFVTFAIFQQIIAVWVIVGIPPMLFMLALGLYQREDQPLETYVIAVVQYFTKPKQRIWVKEPIAEVFHLEPPPPKPEIAKRDPREVRGQLQNLAQLVDTRGWSAKQPELQEVDDEVPVIDLKDRIGAEAIASQQVVPQFGGGPTGPAPQAGATTTATPLPANADITEADDMLADTNPTTQNLNVLIENSVKSIREEAVQKMRQPAPPKPAPKPAAKPALKPKSAQNTVSKPDEVSTTVLTAPLSGDILKLASEGGDLTVAQIASQAHKRQQDLAEGQTVTLRYGNTTNTAT